MIDIGKAFREIGLRLRSFIRGYVGDDEADDVVQDVFLRLVKAYGDSTDDIADLSAWLYRVARNLLINRSKKYHEESLPGTPGADTEADAEFLADVNEILFIADAILPKHSC